MSYYTQNKFGEFTVFFRPPAPSERNVPGNAGMWQGLGREFGASGAGGGHPAIHYFERNLQSAPGGASSSRSPASPQFRHPQRSRETMLHAKVEPADAKASKAWMSRQCSLQRSEAKRQEALSYERAPPISSAASTMSSSQSLPALILPGAVRPGDLIESSVDFQRENGEVLRVGDVGTVVGPGRKGRVEADFPSMRSVDLWPQHFKKFQEKPAAQNAQKCAAMSAQVYQTHGFLNGCGALGIQRNAHTHSGFHVRNTEGRSTKASRGNNTVSRKELADTIGGLGTRGRETKKTAKPWREESPKGSYVLDASTGLPVDRPRSRPSQGLFPTTKLRSSSSAESLGYSILLPEQE